jgi:hypothetical protein
MADASINTNTKPLDTTDITNQQAQTQAALPKQPGVFRRALGAIAGGALNLVAPGAGTALGGLISGGMPNLNGMGSNPMEYLALQQRIQNEARQFEAASAVLKSKHDAAMSAIRNMH